MMVDQIGVGWAGEFVSVAREAGKKPGGRQAAGREGRGGRGRLRDVTRRGSWSCSRVGFDNVKLSFHARTGSESRTGSVADDQCRMDTVPLSDEMAQYRHQYKLWGVMACCGRWLGLLWIETRETTARRAERENLVGGKQPRELQSRIP